MLSSPVAAAAQTYQEWHEQLEQSVARNAWDAADAAYRGVLDTTKKPTPLEHVLGARAALALGNINDAIERLEEADGEEEFVAQSLGEVRNNYADAKLKVPGSHSGSVSLVARDNPIDPAKRRTVELTRKALEAKGKYSGLLPVGRYRLGKTEFEVVIGEMAKAKFE